MSEHIRLHIPGPVEVSPATYEAMAAPMIGHRTKDFVALYDSIQPRLQELMGTKQPVFLSTSSAWGVMEGAIRNLVIKKVLCCCSGAFPTSGSMSPAVAGKRPKRSSSSGASPSIPPRLMRNLPPASSTSSLSSTTRPPPA